MIGRSLGGRPLGGRRLGERTLWVGGGPSTFEPLSLFAQYSAAGFLYDRLDPAAGYLFQDSSLTTPVTAASDPVGGINDRGPSNKDATQATSGAEATYNVTSGVHRLTFDGAADHLDLPASFAVAAGAFTLVALVNGAAQSFKSIYGESDNTTGQSMLHMGSGQVNTAVPAFFLRNSVGGSSTIIQGSVTAFDSSWHVVSWVDTGSNISFTVDGAAAGSTNYTRAGIYGVVNAAIGCRPKGTPDQFFNGSVGRMFGIAAALSASDLAKSIAALRMGYV